MSQQQTSPGSDRKTRNSGPRTDQALPKSFEAAGAEIADSIVELTAAAKPRDITAIGSDLPLNGGRQPNTASFAYRSGDKLIKARHFHGPARDGGPSDVYTAYVSEIKKGTETVTAVLPPDASKNIFEQMKSKFDLNARLVEERAKEILGDLGGARTQLDKIEWKSSGDRNSAEHRAYYRGINIRAVSAPSADGKQRDYQVRVDRQIVNGEQAKEIFMAIEKSIAAKRSDKLPAK